NESLVELRSLHRRSKLGKVWRASPLYSRHSLPNFSSRTFASWGARRIWIGINTTSAIHSLGDCKTRINPRITTVPNTQNWIENFGIKTPCDELHWRVSLHEPLSDAVNEICIRWTVTGSTHISGNLAAMVSGVHHHVHQYVLYGVRPGLSLSVLVADHFC